LKYYPFIYSRVFRSFSHVVGELLQVKAKHEGWQRADSLVKKSDTNLKKISNSLNKITSVEEFEGFISSIEDEEDKEFEHSEVPQEVYQFDFIKELVEDEKRNIKNPLTTSQVRRKKQAEVIVKSRKRICSYAVREAA
jgi:hypothetical protein